MTRTAVILAGGKSARMGGKDKGKIDFGGPRLFDLVLERLRLQVDRIIISGSEDYGTELELMPDLDNGPQGPAAALCAMINSHKDVKGFMTVPVDGPFFPGELYERLFGNRSAIAKGPERAHPTYAFWTTKDLQSVFDAHPGKNLALHQIAEEVGARKVSFRAESYFRNFNAPEDLDFTI